VNNLVLAIALENLGETGHARAHSIEAWSWASPAQVGHGPGGLSDKTLLVNTPLVESLCDQSWNTRFIDQITMLVGVSSDVTYAPDHLFLYLSVR
jgi:hypothetical protein